MSSTHYDIIVFGATGFTGRLITQYLATHPQFKDGLFTFAIAARSQSKLHTLIQELSLPKEIGTVKLDVTDPGEVEAVVKTARVIINTVGPYYLWGTPVVRYDMTVMEDYLSLIAGLKSLRTERSALCRLDGRTSLDQRYYFEVRLARPMASQS
jgi:short subunit dehydrogenase-like uncharacterized protein